MKKRRMTIAGLATSAALAGSLGFAGTVSAHQPAQPSAPAATAAAKQFHAQHERCTDTVVRTFVDRANVSNAPGTSFRRVVTVRILQQIVAHREWSPRAGRCVFRGWETEPVYRDTPGDGTRREHLVLASRILRTDRTLGAPVSYWRQGGWRQGGHR